MNVINEEVIKLVRGTLSKELDEEINVSINNQTSDGFTGDINFITVNGKTQNGETRVYNFVMKSSFCDDKLRDRLEIRDLYKNEIFVYKNVFPVFEEFQKKNRVKNMFSNVPKYFGSVILNNCEALILENLKTNNYCLWDMRKPLDQSHIEIILKAYGQFHAISLVLRSQEPEVFEKIVKGLKNLAIEFNSILSNLKPPLFSDIIQIAKENNDCEILKIATSLETNFKDLDQASKTCTLADPFTVIIHGDCWNNNYLFQYKDQTKTELENVSFLDWQLSRLASPVCDISYFLFTCASCDDLLVNFDKYNSLYYESLSGFLKELGGDSEILFPHEVLMEHWKLYSKYGLYRMPLIIRTCLSDEGSTNEIESDDVVHALYNFYVRNKKEYARRCFGVLKLAAQRNFI